VLDKKYLWKTSAAQKLNRTNLLLGNRVVVRRLPAPVSLSWPHSKNRGAEEYYHGYKHNSCGADVAHEYASNRARFFSFLAMSPQNVTLSYTSALLLHIYPGGSSGGGGTESGSNKIYTHTHSSRIPLHANSQHTPPLAFSNAKREILHKTRPHREFFNAARAKEGAEIKFCARRKFAAAEREFYNANAPSSLSLCFMFFYFISRLRCRFVLAHKKRAWCDCVPKCAWWKEKNARKWLKLPRGCFAA
jgi:hypothetical protein